MVARYGSMIAACALLAACSSPAVPSPAGYAGSWSGTTAQGMPISFTISAEEAVTTLTVGHAFNGCSASQTFSSLSLRIAPMVSCIPGPCPASVTSFRSFDYAAGNSFSEPSIDVHGLFPSAARAEGTVNFRNYPGCGTAIGVSWTATRR